MTIIKKRQEVPVFGDVLSNLFEDRFFEPLKNASIKRTPSVNIFENDEDFRIQLAIPGMSKSDFNIDIKENTLAISAEKTEDNIDKSANYTVREFNYSNFNRVFTLPKNVNKDGISAKYTEGILEISIPKVMEEKSINKRIEIQ